MSTNFPVSEDDDFKPKITGHSDKVFDYDLSLEVAAGEVIEQLPLPLDESAAEDLPSSTESTDCIENSLVPDEQSAPIPPIPPQTAPEPAFDSAVLKRIDSSLDSFHTRAEQYEATNRLLHTRIEELQHDQVRALLKPMFERLATLQAQATESAVAAAERDSSSAGDFEFFAITIDELLALYDVESVGAASGAEFDSRNHHGARTVPTEDPTLHGKIQRVQRQGYRFAGAERVMLPARVSVYRHVPPVEIPSAGSAETTTN